MARATADYRRAQEPLDSTDGKERSMSDRQLEIARLVGYLLLTVAVAPAVANIIGRAWLRGGPLVQAVLSSGDLLGVGLGGVAALGFGVYVGFLTMMWLDEMKRVNALLLTLATGAGLVALARMDIFVRYLTVSNLGLVLMGAIASMAFAGGRKLVDESRPWQFPVASYSMFLLIAGIGVGGYVQLHVLASGQSYPGVAFPENAYFELWEAASNPVTDFGATAAFMFAVLGLVVYDMHHTNFSLGPGRSGKSTKAAAEYDQAEQVPGNQNGLDPTEPLQQNRQRLLAADSGWGGIDEPNADLEYERLGFTLRTGRLFQRNTRLETLDYAGEYVGKELEEAIESRVPKSRLSLNYLTYKLWGIIGSGAKRGGGSVTDDDDMYALLAREIIHADSLTLLLDGTGLAEGSSFDGLSYTSSPGEYLQTYVSILSVLENSVISDKDVYLTLTKADVFREQYDEEFDLPASLSFEDFKEFVNTDLRARNGGREVLDELFRTVDDPTIYPVHYEIDEEESEEAGHPVPKHPIETHGFVEYLEAVTGR